MFHTIVGWACFFAHADTESPRGHKLRAHPTLLIPQWRVVAEVLQ